MSSWFVFDNVCFACGTDPGGLWAVDSTGNTPTSSASLAGCLLLVRSVSWDQCLWHKWRPKRSVCLLEKRQLIICNWTPISLQCYQICLMLFSPIYHRPRLRLWIGRLIFDHPHSTLCTMYHRVIMSTNKATRLHLLFRTFTITTQNQHGRRVQNIEKCWNFWGRHVHTHSITPSQLKLRELLSTYPSWLILL